MTIRQKKLVEFAEWVLRQLGRTCYGDPRFVRAVALHAIEMELGGPSDNLDHPFTPWGLSPEEELKP